MRWLSEVMSTSASRSSFHAPVKVKIETAAMPGADPTRWVALRDLAAVIAFLASDAARAVHGAAVPVTGLS